ncbi:hypothetical protein BV20DRAFT_591365 [Pilatotrama ljubarskyi]|nr:hypothetical protein BV20DRAFT_591365 [Pilatotrama ljubarskyi]
MQAAPRLCNALWARKRPATEEALDPSAGESETATEGARRDWFRGQRTEPDRVEGDDVGAGRTQRSPENGREAEGVKRLGRAGEPEGGRGSGRIRFSGKEEVYIFHARSRTRPVLELSPRRRPPSAAPELTRSSAPRRQSALASPSPPRLCFSIDSFLYHRIPSASLLRLLLLALSAAPSLCLLPSAPFRDMSYVLHRPPTPPPPPEEDALSAALHAALRPFDPTPQPLPPPPELLPNHLQQHHDRHDMHHDKKSDKHPHLEIHVASDVLCLRGTGVDVNPALLSGNLVLYLSEPTSIKEITLSFRGKARLPVSAAEP